MRLPSASRLSEPAEGIPRREGNVAIDAGEFLQLVQIADELGRLGADGLDRIGDEHRGVVAERDPPQQRVAHVDLVAAQAIEERAGSVRELAARAVADRTEIVRIDLAPVFGLVEQRPGLAGAKRGLPDDRYVPVQLS